LYVEVTDDGAGGADIEAGTGLRGLEDRVQAVGGRMTLQSAVGRGTTLSVRLPLSTKADVGRPA
jgi:signal transduction histidine kinase